MKLIIGKTSLYFKNNLVTGITIYTKNIVEYFLREHVNFKGFVFKSLKKGIDIELAVKHNEIISNFPNLIGFFAGNIKIAIEENLIRGCNLFFAPDHRIPFFKKTPVVATIHDAIPALYPQWTGDKFLKREKVIIEKSAKWVEKIITVSNVSANALVKCYRIPEKKIEVIYNGIDEKFFEKIPFEKIKQILDKYNLKYKKYILNVGAVQPRKNHEKLIGAYDLLKEDVKKEYDLVIIGEKGWKCEETINRLNEMVQNNCCKWIKYVEPEELRAIYQGAEIFVFPSLYEGFGYPVIEAFASEVPVIASNCSSIPEIAGGAALLIAPHNENEISEAIMYLLNNHDKMEEYIMFGKKQAKFFKLKSSMESHLKLFKKISC